MYNPEEIQRFCPKRCYLRPSSNLFSNCTNFLKKSTPQVFSRKITHQKKQGEMLTELIIEFELRGPGVPRSYMYS